MGLAEGNKKDLRVVQRSPTAAENASIQSEVDALFVKVIQNIIKKRNETLAGPAEAVIRSSAIMRYSEANILVLVDAI